MTPTLSSFVLAAAAALAHGAYAQHLGDIGLSVADGAIYTRDIDSSGYGPPRLVFQGTLGDTGSPHFSSNPGFDAPPGTFGIASRIGFRFVAEVLVWNGSAFVQTDPAGPLAGERFKGTFLTVSATSGSGPSPGFDLAAQPNGAWHRHISWTLLPAQGARGPDPGVYLLQLQMYSTDPAVADSAPFAIVWSDNGSAQDVQDAYAAAESLYYGASCPADMNGDGTVDGADLGALLGSWGMHGAADLNGDGIVDGADLGALLGSWGLCH